MGIIGETTAKKAALEGSALNLITQIEKKADFLSSFEKYIRDAEKDKNPALIKLWNTIKEDEQKHLKMLREELASSVMETRLVDSEEGRDLVRPTTRETAAELKVDFDDIDKKIAETLLMRGYYETPRPPGVTQDVLSKEIGISKPTLEEHMRKIQSIGLKNLLAQIEFTDKDWDLSWKALQTKIKPKKS